MEPVFYARYPSPLGELLLTGKEAGLTGIWFPDGQYAPKPTGTQAGPEHPVFRDAAAWLDGYFSGKNPDPSAVRLSPAGTPFQELVWARLRRIPYGGTAAYGTIAKELEQVLGHRVAAQAVGGAVGRNPISILIPCHRVVGANGVLTGYGGGLWRKEFLLKLERAF